MRKLTVLIALALALTACIQNGPSDRSVPGGDTQPAGTPVGESPRVEVPPTPTIPATYTPIPHEHGGHLFAVSGGVVPAGATLYTVQRGDTLAKICARFETTLDALVQANNIRNINHIEVGQVLIIP